MSPDSILCEGSCLQNEGLTLLLISLPADSTTGVYYRDKDN